MLPPPWKNMANEPSDPMVSSIHQARVIWAWAKGSVSARAAWARRVSQWSSMAADPSQNANQASRTRARWVLSGKRSAVTT